MKGMINYTYIQQNKGRNLLFILIILSCLNAQAQSSNDSIQKANENSMQLVNMWKYRSRNPLVPKAPYAGIGYVYKGKYTRITFNANEFERDLQSCETCLELFDKPLYQKESKKTLIITLSGLTLFTVGGVLLASQALNYNPGTAILSIPALGAGLIMVCSGTYKLIRKTNVQRQLIQSAIKEFNRVH